MTIDERLPVGFVRSITFSVTEHDQAEFARLSGDTNPIHLNADHARARGFAGPVVYGGLLLARLSQIIGLWIPGEAGLWSGVQLDFRHALLVNEPASLTAEITHVSEATRSLVLKVTVASGDRIIASGKAMATLFPAS